MSTMGNGLLEQERRHQSKVNDPHKAVEGENRGFDRGNRFGGGNPGGMGKEAVLNPEKKKTTGGTGNQT